MDQTDVIILNEYPYPLAASYQRALNEQDAQLKPKMLVAAFEALIKYCAIIAIQDGYRSGLNPPRFSATAIEQLFHCEISGIFRVLQESLLLFRRNSELIIDPDLYYLIYDDFRETPRARAETAQWLQILLALAEKYSQRSLSYSEEECEQDYQSYFPTLRALWHRATFVTRLQLLYFHDPVDEVAAIEQPSEKTLTVAIPMMGLQAISQAITSGRLVGAPFGRLCIKAHNKNILLGLHPLLMLVETIELMPATTDQALPRGALLIISYDEIRGADQEKLLRLWQLIAP
ncbi:MAG: hypothetical protein AB1489_03565, partial [Acidobacteriota bacterium]